MRLRHRKWTDRVLEENQDIGKNLETLDINIVKDYHNLEIGCGLGSFLFELSRQHPETNYLGIEINKNAFATAVKNASLIKAEQTNFLLVNSPIERMFPLFEEKQLDNIYINFPDPWPKKRQKHRRLSYPTMLKEYERLLKDDGTLYFRTDNKDLFEDSIEYFKQADIFDFEVIEPFYSEKVDYLPPTEYERKFRALGVDIHLIRAKKKQK